METIYIKKGRRYVDAGYIGAPELQDGVWLVQKNPGSKSTSSLIWKIGDIPLADMQLHASLQRYSDELTEVLAICSKPDKRMSLYDVTSTMLRELAKLIQRDNEKKDYNN